MFLLVSILQTHLFRLLNNLVIVEVPTFLVAGHETTRFELKHDFFLVKNSNYTLKLVLRRPGRFLR